MALIKCPECGKEISDKSSACIHCGYPLANIKQEKNDNTQPQLNNVQETGTNEATLGFTLFSIDESSVNLECKNCSKVYKFNRKTVFSEASEKECIPNNTICCPNCGNTAHKDTKIHPKQKAQPTADSKQAVPDVSKADDKSSTGFRIYLIFIGVVIIGGIWFLVDTLGGFHFGITLIYILAVLVCGFILYIFLCAIFASGPEEVKQNWDKEKYNDYKFTCPMCGSKKVKKIGNVNRAASVVTMGLASSKIGKQYECDDCKHKW